MATIQVQFAVVNPQMRDYSPVREFTAARNIGYKGLRVMSS